MRWLLVWVISAAGLWAASSEGAADAPPLVKGRVTRLLPDLRVVMVKHEEIPGVMRAMTMGFAVPDAVWDSLEPGSYLTGYLHGAHGHWRLTDVVLTDRHYQPLPQAEDEAAVADKEAAPPASAAEADQAPAK